MADPDDIRLQEGAIDLGAVHASARDPGCGAVCCFEGTTRDVHDGRPVALLAYEAYRDMAEAELRRLARDLRARFPAVVRVVLAHRLGEVPLGETSVAVAVSTPHRAEAFEACRFAIDELKARVPIWKRESYRDGGAPSWVGNRESRVAATCPGPRSEPEERGQR